MVSHRIFASGDDTERRYEEDLRIVGSLKSLVSDSGMYEHR